MNRAVKYILSAAVIVLAVAYLVVCLSLVREKRQDTHCTGLNVIVLDSVHTSFITAGDVGRYLDREYGKYIGIQIDSLNLTKIESIIDRKSVVLKSQAYVSTDGTLNIRISQRTPLLLFKTDSTQYFTDDEEFIFPMQGRGTDRVIQVTGSIPLTVGKDFKGELKDEAETEWLSGIVAIAQYIRKHHVWEEVDMTALEEGDIILSPTKENINFIFGSPKEIQRKFGRINNYYLAVVPSKGEDHYSSVNVKYAGQIICRDDDGRQQKRTAEMAAKMAAERAAAKEQEDSTRRQELIDAATMAKEQEESRNGQEEAALTQTAQAQETPAAAQEPITHEPAGEEEETTGEEETQEEPATDQTEEKTETEQTDNVE